MCATRLSRRKHAAGAPARTRGAVTVIGLAYHPLGNADWTVTSLASTMERRFPIISID
jgi:hypothetical protein